MEATTVHLRWMIRRDVTDGVKKIERETGGDWTEREFLSRLRNRSCIAMVAETAIGITGFAVYELSEFEMRVVNMVALDTPFRLALIARMDRKAISHRRELVWDTN